MNAIPRLKALRLHQEIQFGLDGNDAPFLGAGWAEPELAGRWTLGDTCYIRTIHPGATDLLIEIDTVPPAMTPPIGVQRIDLETDGQAAGTFVLAGQHRLALLIPASCLKEGPILTLQLNLPAARRPGDASAAGEPQALAVCFRRLSIFTVKAAAPARRQGTGTSAGQARVSPETALACFEGLGESSGFGRVQRHAGIQPAGLLASARIALPHLLQALDDGFAGLGEPGSFDITLYPHNALDYVVTDSTYAVAFHGVQNRHEIQLRAFLEQQGAWLRDARRELLRCLAEGDRIFVYRSTPALTGQEILPLLIALNRRGPATLLWVTEADPANPPGTVEQIVPYLLHGRIGPDAPVSGAAFEAWLELCLHALDIALPAATRGNPPMLQSVSAVPPDPPAATIPMANAPPHQEPAPPAPPPVATLDNEPARRTAEPGTEAGITKISPIPAEAGTISTLVPDPQGPASSGNRPYALLQSWEFGEGGTEEGVLGFGWAGPEAGFRWTDGDACELWLDHQGKRDMFVVIEAWPFVTLPQLPRQRAEISAHDTPLGTLVFTETMRKAVLVTASSLRPGRVMRLRCSLPDATRPSDILTTDDERQIALGFMRVAVHTAPGRLHGRHEGAGGLGPQAVQAQTGLSPQELVERFELLGESQDLANLQIELGASPQNLLHRKNLRLLNLVRAVETRFEGIATPGKLLATQLGEDQIYEITDEATGLSYVTERSAGDANIETLIAREARQLKFLRDQFLSDLSSGEKIFVYHRAPEDTPVGETEMLPLLLALRQNGPATLLFLCEPDETNRPGTVEHLYPGLLRGTLAAAGSDDETQRNVWLEVCACALGLVA